MIPRLFDTHAHLDSPVLDKDLDIIVKHAVDDGIWIVTVGHDLESSRKAVALAERFPTGVYAAVGIHPLKVASDVMADDKLVDLQAFRQLVQHDKVIAIGETGLDFHDLPMGNNDIEIQLANRIRGNQQKAFNMFLELSREHRLPMLLHCREAHDEMLHMIEVWDKATKGFDSRGIIHCFNGNWKQARRYFNLDFMISVTGTMTSGSYQSEILKKAPLTRLMVESDCPHLTAVPYGLRRSEPRYVETVAAQIAGMRDTPVAEVEQQLMKNTRLLFPRLILDMTE